MEQIFDVIAESNEKGEDSELITKHCFVTSQINHLESTEGTKLLCLLCCDDLTDFKLQKWIYSKESILVPGERGLFAGKPFKKGDTISVYCGKKVGDEVNVSPYRLLDIEPWHEELLCHYINDILLSLTLQLRKYAEIIGSNHEQDQCKHWFTKNAEFLGTKLLATRDFKTEEELFADYNYDSKERIKMKNEFVIYI